MKEFLLAGVLCIFCTSVSAQEVTGQVTDTQTGKPIPWANIGVINKGIGTVSQGDGRFALVMDQAYDNDTLRLSCIGFSTLDVVVGNIRSGQYDGQFSLEPSNVELMEVTVVPRDVTPEILGNTFNFGPVSAGFASDDLGSEAGVVMRTKRKRTYYPKAVGFYISTCSYDSILFRVNVFEYDSNKVGRNLLPEAVYVTAKKGDKHVVVDLRPYGIQTTDDFLVTLEWLQDLSQTEGGFMFCAGFGSTGIMYRKTSQARFEKLPGAGIGLYCLADVEKDPKN